MVPFPHSAFTTTIKSKARDDMDIPMLECTKRSKWFHVNCEVIPKLALEESLVTIMRV